MKKYRLLQEYRTPNAIIHRGGLFVKKEGKFLIGFPAKEVDCYEYEEVSNCGKGFVFRLPLLDVELHRDWFEEVKEEPILPVDWQQQQEIQMQKEINEKFFRQLINDGKQPLEPTTIYVNERLTKLSDHFVKEMDKIDARIEKIETWVLSLDKPPCKRKSDEQEIQVTPVELLERILKLEHCINLDHGFEKDIIRRVEGLENKIQPWSEIKPMSIDTLSRISELEQSCIKTGDKVQITSELSNVIVSTQFAKIDKTVVTT